MGGPAHFIVEFAAHRSGKRAPEWDRATLFAQMVKNKGFEAGYKHVGCTPPTPSLSTFFGTLALFPRPSTNCCKRSAADVGESNDVRQPRGNGESGS
ncbi:hypothetical protein IAQ61_005080 [Plenodomus lingam]|uniref:uncharacterized protein n=1 Tax=Leptosphaeria maculans TaxID=5022 RepID=UPI003316FEB5|nr:hypothetical protein IAQ61_005080 [Plenodomus lingam]